MRVPLLHPRSLHVAVALQLFRSLRALPKSSMPTPYSAASARTTRTHVDQKKRADTTPAPCWLPLPLEICGQPQSHHLCFVVSGETQNWSGAQVLGRTDVPPRSRPPVVITNVVRLEHEMVGDAVCDIGFIHLTTGVGFGSDDVVFSVREVKPIFRSMVELEPNLRPPIIFRDAVANTDIIHLAVVIDGGIVRITPETAKGSGLAVRTEAVEVCAAEQIEVAQLLLQ